MGKKINYDIEELKKAITHLRYVEGGEWFADVYIAFNQLDLSNNWNSPSGKEFEKKIQVAFKGFCDLQKNCTVLRKYCETAKRNAEHSDDLIAQLFDNIVDNVGGFINHGIDKVNDLIHGLFGWMGL